jgi:SAM-dependent methyltransferase
MVTEASGLAAEGEAGRCPACGGPRRDWRSATASVEGLATGTSFRLERCLQCGSAVTIGPPAPAELYEGGTYAPARPRADRAIAPLRRLIERDKLRFLGDLGAGSRILEVGAGDGSFVAAMRAAEFDARGVEPSRRAVTAAGAHGIPVAQGTIEESEPDGPVDAVVAWHVLEHVDDPAAALGRMRGWLRPGGTLVVACPNLSSLQARIAGDRWFHQDVPRHRVHFTAGGLATLVERAGFAVERLSHLLIEQNPLGMWLALLNRLTAERDLAFRLLKSGPAGEHRARDVLVTLLLGLPLAAIAVPLELLAGLARRGGSVVLVARRA